MKFKAFKIFFEFFRMPEMLNLWSDLTSTYSPCSNFISMVHKEGFSLSLYNKLQDQTILLLQPITKQFENFLIKSSFSV